MKTYPICRWSGDLGPKKKEGDRQAPEGFYAITRGQINPNSNYYLAFNTGFPNAFDRAHGYTGSELMVHGDCSSRGCYAMTDEQIQEIYALARESFYGGQKEFQFQAFPFRMTALNMAKHRNNPNFAFWKEIKEGYDDFEATHQEPKVAVCEKRYVFDRGGAQNATARCNSIRAANARPTGSTRRSPTRCSITGGKSSIRWPSTLPRASSLAPPHVGDGGMNPVFASKARHPGSLRRQRPPRPDRDRARRAAAHGLSISARGTVVMPASAAPPAPQPSATQPVMLASVPMPQPAPQPKEGEAPPEQPKSIASLIGNMFGGSPAEARPAAPAQRAQRGSPLRGSNTHLAGEAEALAP